MAKKKAITSSSRPKSSSASKHKSRAGTKTAKRPAPKTSPAVKPTKKRASKSSSSPRTVQLSNQQIGDAAGHIWHSLTADNGQTLAALRGSTKVSPDLVLAAVGWLAREGKLEFAANGRSVKVWLR